MRDMSFAAPLLALSDSDQPMLVWWIIGALIALGPAIRAWIEVIQYFKGKGINTSEFVTKAEFAAAKAERDMQLVSTVTEIRTDFDKLEKFMSDIARDLPAIHRALGRLEGHDDATLKRPR